MKIGMQIIFCMPTVLLQMHTCLEGDLRKTWKKDLDMCVFHASIIGAPHSQGLRVSYYTLKFTLQNVHKPTTPCG